MPMVGSLGATGGGTRSPKRLFSGLGLFFATSLLEFPDLSTRKGLRRCVSVMFWEVFCLL